MVACTENDTAILAQLFVLAMEAVVAHVLKARYQLWQQLDSDRTGYVSLRDISEAGRIVRQIDSVDAPRFRTCKNL